MYIKRCGVDIRQSKKKIGRHKTTDTYTLLNLFTFKDTIYKIMYDRQDINSCISQSINIFKYTHKICIHNTVFFN